VLSTLLFIYFIHVISYSGIYIFSLSAHMLYAHALSSLFLHTAFAYPDLWLFIADQVFGEDYMCYEELESLFLIIGILTLLFLLFPDSFYIMFNCHFFRLFICYHCVRSLYVILQ